MSAFTMPVHDEPGIRRYCHFCGGPIPNDEAAVEAKTKNAWAHFECWYDGAPFPRDLQTGKADLMAESRNSGSERMALGDGAKR